MTVSGPTSTLSFVPPDGLEEGPCSRVGGGHELALEFLLRGGRIDAKRSDRVGHPGGYGDGGLDAARMDGSGGDAALVDVELPGKRLGKAMDDKLQRIVSDWQGTEAWPKADAALTIWLSPEASR